LQFFTWNQNKSLQKSWLGKFDRYHLHFIEYLIEKLHSHIHWLKPVRKKARMSLIKKIIWLVLCSYRYSPKLPEKNMIDNFCIEKIFRKKKHLKITQTDSILRVSTCLFEETRCQFYQHFCSKLLRTQIPKAQNVSEDVSIFLRFWDLQV